MERLFAGESGDAQEDPMLLSWLSQLIYEIENLIYLIAKSQLRQCGDDFLQNQLNIITNAHTHFTCTKIRSCFESLR